MVPSRVGYWVIVVLGVTGVGGDFGNQLEARNNVNFGSTNRRMRTPMHMVQMTQRGYIQFLRWELAVPDIHEFTFCLWVQSKNLTYAHSIFSYSKNERDRLIRSWISPGGRGVHLEIAGANIFTLRTYIAENQWHHVCTSWDNAEGRYAMWIDGRIVIQGLAPQMRGHVIPSNGDIVVGQEYTDFDKGLEEGIEGAVLGFNLLLASAFESASSRKVSLTVPFYGNTEDFKYGAKLETPILRRGFDIEPGAVRERYAQKYPAGNKPLGLQLVDVTYNHCEIGRGSPFIGGSKMLISWTRTPVLVFGGAILKNVESNCGIFSPKFFER